MALDLTITVQNNTSSIILVDGTGDYDATSNTGGWGTPNADETDLSDVVMVVTAPGATEDTINPLGTYDNGTDYVEDDVVYYSSAWYKCIVDSTGNLPTDTDYWEPFSVNDLGAFLASTLSKDITSIVEDDEGLSLTDGIWKYNILVAWDGTQPVGTQTYEPVYALRLNTIAASLARTALRDLDSIDFAEMKSKYDRAILAFDSGEYVLAEDLIEELTELLSEQSAFVRFVRCTCLP